MVWVEDDDLISFVNKPFFGAESKSIVLKTTHLTLLVAFREGNKIS